MSPELKGKLLNAGGQAAMVFLTGIAVYQGFTEILATPDKLYQPLIQASIQFLVGLGIGRIARSVANGSAGTPK